MSLGLPLALLTLALYDKTVFLPFVPGIKIKSGKILWLAGTTALPVYHDHPHKREQIQQYMTGNLEEQTKRTMDGIKQTLDAAGASFKDVVHMFVFRARPQMGDIGRAARVINSYFAPFTHKPTSTNIAVLELGEPGQLIEIRGRGLGARTLARPALACPGRARSTAS